MSDIENRCRLVLIAPPMDDPDAARELIAGALRGGDVASVILPQYGLDERAFQDVAEAVVPLVQKAGAAAMVAGDSRIAARSKADGLHVDGGRDVLADAIERFSPGMMVGAGRAKDRHSALEIGELRPDYVFFGKLDGDIKAEPHPRNLALAEWWASMVEIPCIVMGGRDISSVVEIAQSGAEFVALRDAVFAEPGAAAIKVTEANALLDEKAPRFGD
ncbi:thiamine phosphate synthase [Hoeflea prorocentri]|uniref:Thiamine phosphate synthase n=1 Tax=Hoeflea prorocentri TaxID=1922333 RepID=A0A9X3UD86_9HYPH|nr:thiamine phosphate synthase [Hoeflea prorocentri]MCY6379277.1 thiamine phosphate synthase [Hoeflea prorocentri]MDA5397078.1 thiamine phosphate synthase [Hoeflea prorocentri]